MQVRFRVIEVQNINVLLPMLTSVSLYTSSRAIEQNVFPYLEKTFGCHQVLHKAEHRTTFQKKKSCHDNKCVTLCLMKEVQIRLAKKPFLRYPNSKDLMDFKMERAETRILYHLSSTYLAPHTPPRPPPPPRPPRPA